jgi:hypothetical protein
VGRRKARGNQRKLSAELPEIKEAAKYNEMYARRWSKRWITRREYALLRRLLASQPHCATLLDLPSGGGRLSPQIAEYTDLLIEADIALGQVQYGRNSAG